MNAVRSATSSLALVILLAGIAYLGVAGIGLTWVFGVVVPYLAVAIFLIGFTGRILTWGRSPVPFRIPTTAGQQKSLDWIHNDELEAPSGKAGVVGRMLLEVLAFRSLFRNTRAEMRKGPRLVFGDDKILWLTAIALHYGFLVILLRHLRFFSVPVPGFVNAIESVDGFVEVTLPTVYVSTCLFTVALLFILCRRLFNPQVRYISLPADYFPLFLLLGVAVSGIVMRHVAKTDILGIKELAVGLLSFAPAVPADAGVTFYVHLFLISSLLAYFPFSKLMHMGGVFLSPTRNMANSNRLVRHVNPWNPEVRVHAFDEWAEEFKEEIAEAGYELKR